MGRRTLLFLALLPILSCATAQEASAPEDADVQEAKISPAEAPPTGKLPEDVTPLGYVLDLEIDPRKERFSGRVEIQVRLEKARDVVWLHGNRLDVKEAFAKEPRVKAKYEQIDEEGLSKLTFTSPIGPGELVLVLAYEAPFDDKLKGLYRVEEAGEAYAFTQFESHFARLCFPGFDEPRFKTPYDISVTVREGDEIITATPEIRREQAGEGKVRVRFAKTKPLPTYLIAFAVGPLDIVEAEPIPPNAVRKEPLPFRGVAAKGKGEKLAYALANTAPLLERLEAYFDIPFPFEKLDIIAVPDFASGAMENVGAVKFREFLLLVDEETAPTSQKRAFAVVMAHELAHMWFGNLVTMPWWDDIWLNEAFATWMAYKVTGEVHPEYGVDVHFLERVLGAMGQDSLTSARQIRQPVETTHDIRNAFDAITYSKGGGVLAMFERWLSEETFREGIRRYLQKHSFGSATYEDLLAALSEASGKDVATPFETFLFQPGVPFVTAELSCEGAPKLLLSQRRFFPVGSAGNPEQTWQIPVCARYGQGGKVKESCTLLSEAKGELLLEGVCPAWVMPNAEAAGYYLFSLPSGALLALEEKGQLSAKEKVAFATSLKAAFDAAALPADDVFARLGRLAKEPHRAVAKSPMRTLSFARHRLVEEGQRKQVDAFAIRLYEAQLARLGLMPKEGEEPEVKELRRDVLAFLALEVHHAPTLERLAKLGRTYLGVGGDGALHPEAVPPSLVDTAVRAAVRTGGKEVFNAALAHLEKTTDATVRTHLLAGLASTTNPELALLARELMLDARLRGNEIFTVLFTQASQPETHPALWRFVMERYDALVARLPSTHQGSLPWVATGFCSEEEAKEVEAFFAPRIEGLIGGPRNLKGALEAVRLCAARVEAHREAAQRFFSSSRVAGGKK